MGFACEIIIYLIYSEFFRLQIKMEIFVRACMTNYYQIAMPQFHVQRSNYTHTYHTHASAWN